MASQVAVSAKKECSSQVFLHFYSYFAYIGPISEIRGKVDQNSPIGLPAEKKVTEGAARVGIVSKSWFPGHAQIYPTGSGWRRVGPVLQHGYLRWQTGLAARLPVKRAPCTGLRKNIPNGSFVRSPGLQLLSETTKKTPGDPTKDVGLRRPVQGALLQTHRCAASLIPYMGGDSCVGHSTGSDLEQDLTHATCRSRLIHHTLDPSSVTFFSAWGQKGVPTRAYPTEKKVIRGGAV